MKNNLLMIKAEHFIKKASMFKESSVSSALLDSIGLALLGAAAGGAIGGALEDDPYEVHNSMADGAIIGGGIGGLSPILAKILGGNALDNTINKGLDELRAFKNKTPEELFGRASGVL